MKARASVSREPDAHEFLEREILDENFPLHPGRREDESAAGLRTSPRPPVIVDHNPSDR